MISVNFKDINIIFEVLPGELVSINFENVNIFYKLYGSLKGYDSETIGCLDLETGKPIVLDKKTILLENILDLDINSRSNLTNLYKKVESEMSTINRLKHQEIDSKIIQFLTDVSLELDGKFTFDETIEISKLLGVYDFRFDKEEGITIFESFINYLRFYKNLKNYEIIFAIDFIKYLNDDEISILKEELALLDCCLVDISYMSDNRNKNGVRNFFFDKDKCVF